MAHRFDHVGGGPKKCARSWLSGLVLTLVVLLLGCEVGGGAITGSPLSAARTIPDTGITLSPPGTMTPAVSADRAYDLCRTHVADCDTGAPTAVELALMTDTGSNMVAKDTLVWMFSWLRSDRCLFSGGGNPAPNTPAITPKPICDKFAFIDARTDAFYFTDAVLHQ